MFRLHDNRLLSPKKHEIQNLIDAVYPTVQVTSVDAASIFEKGEFNSLFKLQHQARSVLFQELGIMSTNVILDSDVEEYRNGNAEKRTMLEIPVIYYSIERLNLEQLEEFPHRPFVISHEVYTDQIGMDMEMLKFMGNAINL